jgi:alkylation response protein AidB-like acyl-CoA dehydrogenase
MADFGGDPEAFRAEARTWLEENAPQSVRRQPDMTMEQMEGGLRPTADQDLWRQRIGAKGWGTPTWPKEYGGGGLSPAEARVLQQEMARLGLTNPIAGMGPGMFGSTLLEYGTEEQKLRHLPAICRGELRWCQGYSEPNAGSDLASLQTRATTGRSTARRSGPPAPTSPTGASAWCAPTPRPRSTRVSRSC